MPDGGVVIEVVPVARVQVEPTQAQVRPPSSVKALPEHGAATIGAVLPATPVETSNPTP